MDCTMGGAPPRLDRLNGSTVRHGTLPRLRMRRGVPSGVPRVGGRGGKGSGTHNDNPLGFFAHFWSPWTPKVPPRTPLAPMPPHATCVTSRPPCGSTRRCWSRRRVQGPQGTSGDVRVCALEHPSSRRRRDLLASRPRLALGDLGMPWDLQEVAQDVPEKGLGSTQEVPRSAKKTLGSPRMGEEDVSISHPDLPHGLLGCLKSFSMRWDA